METLVFLQQRRPRDPVLAIALQPFEAAGRNNHHMQGLTGPQATLQQSGQDQHGPKAPNEETTRHPAAAGARHGS